MNFAKTAALAVVAGAVASAGVFLGGPAPSGACPPSGFQSAQGFNLTLTGTWFFARATAESPG